VTKSKVFEICKAATYPKTIIQRTEIDHLD
jgi:hypothetical protein